MAHARTHALLSRRSFICAAAAGLCGEPMSRAAPASRPGAESTFVTRGAIITVEDLTLADWPERARAAGLTTLGLHAPRSARQLAAFIRSEPGQRLLARCRQLGLEIEYELHAMSDLLPRELFDTAPECFRVDDKGRRVREWNLCVHSEQAMQTVTENAVDLARELRPTTGRYFYWGDDGIDWCRCPKCADLSDSEQALMVANRILADLRKSDPRAQVAHLAYHNTLPPPRQVKPKPGIFLEYAPIHRRYDVPFEQAGDEKSRREFELLDANLEVFGRNGAQALEYWLDASLFSKWKKPSVKIPFDPKVLAADLEMYARRGIRRVTTFAVYIDADYIRRYGEPPIRQYGDALNAVRRS